MRMNGYFKILVFALLLAGGKLSAQSDSIDYFGQEPPGYYPEKFAPGFFTLKEWGPVFSPDGTEMFYTWQNPGGSQEYHIYHRVYADGVWSEPELAPFTDKNRRPELEPNFTPDGKRLYYDSERSDGFGGADIWYVEKTDTGWSAPVNAGDTINGPSNDNFVSFAPDGTMFFCSDRQKGNWDIDIHYSKYENGAYQAPVRLGDSINTPNWDACPTVLGDKLIFESTPGGGFGRGDVCYSQITGDNFGKGELMSANFNTAKSEYGIVLSPDKKYLFFKHSEEPDVYWVDVEVFDYLGVKEAPFNYITSWYAGIGEQMEKAVHSRLIKRRVVSESEVSPVSAANLVSMTNSCSGCIDTLKKGRKEIFILDETETIASAKVYSNSYYDYLHLVKFDHSWKIMNVLWDFHDVTIVGDSLELVGTMNNYIDDWKAGDTEGLAELLHPRYYGSLALSQTEAHIVNKSKLLDLVAAYPGSYAEADFKLEVLDVHFNTGSVKISLNDSIEYLHCTFQNGKWYILNALRNFPFDPARNYNMEELQIKVSNNKIEDATSAGVEIGKMTVTTPPGNTFHVFLNENAETENDNASFMIADNKLQSNIPFDYSVKHEYMISVGAVINDMDTITGNINLFVLAPDAIHTRQVRPDGIAIYPNPSDGVFTLSMDESYTDNAELVVCSTQGQVILSKTISPAETLTIDLSEYPKGVYLLGLNKDCSFKRILLVE